MGIDPVQLTRQLIDIPSPTGEEQDVALFLEEFLRELGFSCRKHYIGEDRFNLVATASDEPRVLFCTHPEDDESVRGRGACDAKGILASMLHASEQLIAQDERRFGFLLVVGEETDSVGAKRADEELRLESEYIVIGEPTETRFVAACKGAVTAKVRFGGVAAHSAYPEKGDSAIRRMANAIVAIESAEWGTTEKLGRATANVGVVRGGRKPNVVPDEAELELMIRSVEPRPDVIERIRSVVGEYGGEIEETYGGDPVFFHVPAGQEGVVVAFGTDAPYLRSFGERILFGPGSILDAHGREEKIGKSEISSASETYRDLVIELLGR